MFIRMQRSRFFLPSALKRGSRRSSPAKIRRCPLDFRIRIFFKNKTHQPNVLPEVVAGWVAVSVDHVAQVQEVALKKFRTVFLAFGRYYSQKNY